MNNKTVYALYEVHKFEGAFIVALYQTRLDALKSGLALKRKRVQQALDDYRMLGIPEAEYCYRNCWENVSLSVEAEVIN